MRTVAIICGGRDYADRARVAKVLDAAVERMGLHTIIVGRAPGADTLAEEWAMARPDISVIACPADWDGWEAKGNRNAAGPARNKLMLRVLEGTEDEKRVLAFSGGTGTENMIDLAGRAGVRVVRV